MNVDRLVSLSARLVGGRAEGLNIRPLQGSRIVKSLAEAEADLAASVRGTAARWDAVSPHAKASIRAVAPTLAALLDEVAARNGEVARARSRSTAAAYEPVEA